MWLVRDLTNRVNTHEFLLPVFQAMTCYRPLLRLCRKKFGLDSRPDQKDKADDGKNNSPRTMSMQSIEPFTEPNTSALPRNHGLVNNTRDNQEEEKYSEPYLLPSSLEQNVICGDIHKFVRQPTFVCRNEWIAGHGRTFVGYLLFCASL